MRFSFELSRGGRGKGPVPADMNIGTPGATAAAALASISGVSPYIEQGVVGTPIVGGFVLDLGEYKPELYGRDGITGPWEKMRRGDGQVAATLAACKLPARSGRPTVQPAGDTPLDKEIAQFVEDSLLENLEYVGDGGALVSQNWDDVLRNAQLMLDFGCAAHEEVWTVDGDYIRLKKLAPRLPLTFYRFLVAEDGETLIALQQYGYRGDVYGNVDVPAWKLGLFVHGMEGANFWGRPLLREMYPHWYAKTALYKIDAMGCERNALGVPVISHTEHSAPLSQPDRDIAFNFVKNLAANNTTGIYLPPGLEFSLTGVKGQMRNCLPSIQHHNEMISKAALAMFMDLGQAQTGNRSLGVSQQDFFFLAVQSHYDYICRQMTHSAVRRLVDFNYAGAVNGGSKSIGGKPASKRSGYPTLVAPSVQYVKLDQVVDSLTKLAAMNVDIVHPDDDLEDYLRSKMRLPKIGEPRERFAPTAIRVMEGNPGNDDPSVVAPGAGVDTQVRKAPAGPQPSARAAAAAAARATGRQSARKLSEVFQGVPVSRAPRGAEHHLNLNEIVHALDDGKLRVADLLRAKKPAIIAEAIHKAIDAPAGRVHQVSVAPDAELVTAIAKALSPVRQDGQYQVAAERARQRGGAAPASPRAAQTLLSEAADPAAEELGLYAQMAVSEFTNNLTQRSVNRVLDWKKNPGGQSKGAALLAAQQDVEGGKDGWIDNVAGEASNEAFAAGRAAGFAQYSDEIDRYQYSALLDLATCDACSAADGQEGALDDLPDTPNPDCAGGDLCRCVLVAIFSDEAPSQA